MVHLGTQISALADGRLGPESAERALSHVAGCAECAAELAATRAARRVLASAGDVPPANDLALRLLALGNGPYVSAAAGDAPARHRTFRRALFRRSGGRSGEAPLPLPGSQDPVPSGCLRGDVARRGVPVRSLAAATVGIVAVWLFAIGEEETVVPEGHPASALAMLAGVETGQAGVVTTAAAASGPPATGGDAADLALPDGYRVAAAHRGAGMVELGLAGPDGTVVVTRRDGRLAEQVVAGAPVAVVGEAQVWVLSTAPWHVVWQSGETVVDVVAKRGSPAVEAVLTAHPVAPFDDGVAAQIARGWRTLAGAWSP